MKRRFELALLDLRDNFYKPVSTICRSQETCQGTARMATASPILAYRERDRQSPEMVLPSHVLLQIGNVDE